MRNALKFVCILSILSIAVLIGAGEFIFWRVLKVSCSDSTMISKNHPTHFVPNGKNNGPFRGARWDNYVDYDLSRWFLNDVIVEEVKIADEINNIELSAWWLGKNYPNEKKTVVIVHGINASKKHFTQLIPASILVNEGLNVLLFDQRNHGESSCPTGRYFAGTVEWQDINTVVNWLTETKGISANQIGIHAVSGGTLAAQFIMAERSDLLAFSLDSPIFDFEKIVKSELEWNGVPAILWKLAVTIGKFHGIDIYAKKPSDGLDLLNGRALMVFHGKEDTRVPFIHSELLLKYAKDLNQQVDFFANESADHNEALLIEPEVFETHLPNFFITYLK